MRYVFPLVGMLAALVVPEAHANQHDAQAWFNVTYTGHILGRWMGWAEVQARFGEDVGRLSQTVVRPGVGYEIEPGLTVWAGYARQETITAASQFGENRFWQQLLWVPGRIFDGPVTLRTRLEQRLVESGNDTGWRFRQFLRYEHPFQTGGDISVIATSEGYWHLNNADWGARTGLDQVRNFIGIGVTAFPNARLEVGYLNQYIERPGANDRMNHILSVSLLGRF